MNKQEESLNWCTKRGVTPSFEEAAKTVIVLGWAQATNNGRVAAEARARVANIGWALGWDKSKTFPTGDLASSNDGSENPPRLSPPKKKKDRAAEVEGDVAANPPAADSASLLGDDQYPPAPGSSN